jgi:hypothetical protein
VRRTPFSLRHEHEATGDVAAIFADIRKRMSFTPAIFKALAADPPTLERAWAHARPLVDDEAFGDAAGRLRTAATRAGSVKPSAEVEAAVAPFARELPGMLLIVSSLGLTLDGRIPVSAIAPLALRETAAAPEPVVPEYHGDHPVYDAVRDAYGTAHVPTLYRSLAAQGLLEEAWASAGALLASADGHRLIERVAAAGESEALELTRVACFDVESARPLLEQFRVALPRNLVVAMALSGSSAVS